jgi:hypothetical protein
MLFAKGSKVRLKISADTGVVTDILDKDLLLIRLDNGSMEIPVFTEDLEHVSAHHFIEIKSGEDASENQSAFAFPPPERQYSILSSYGIQVGFDAIENNQYRVFMLNDTTHDFIFQFCWITGGIKRFDRHGKLPKTSAVEVGLMHTDDLNIQPEAVIRCARITTEGTGPELEKTLKIKAKTFFSKVITAPLLNRPMHLFQVFSEVEDSKPPNKDKEDLKTYTLRNAKPVQHFSANKWSPSGDLVAKANFSGEIDLHIENLADPSKKRSNAEILRIQIAHFEQFMEEAIRLGAERVFLIHGLGKGKLRDEIASRLIQMKEVKSFHNNYHPRYGFGATEVIFR